MRRGIVALAGLLTAIALPLYAVKVHRKTDYTDFDVYYRAAARAKQGLWDQVYNLGDGASPFRYAPPLLPFFRPFAEMGAEHAKIAWYALQCGWFALGFYFIHRALRLVKGTRARREANWITAAALLFVLRFCLDCFTIGQVSSLLFLGYCASLYAWMRGRAGAAGAALLVPSIFKIGPGFLFSLFAASRKPSERVRSLAAPLACLVAATAFLRAWLGTGTAAAERFTRLWRDWAEIVANDSVYYDASHYGSQSIKSAILRAVNWGWLSASGGQALYLASLVAGCLAILAFWALRRPRTPLGRGLFFALGVFPYLWFMPETFKYSLTTLALPVALLLACPKGVGNARLERAAIAFGFLTLSLPGLDLVGKTVFFALQRGSVPLVATFLLAAAVLRQAHRHSGPALGLRRDRLAPWRKWPMAKGDRAVSVLLPLPLSSVSSLPPSWVHRFLEETRAFFAERGETFEVLVAPYGDRASLLHPAWMEACQLAATHADLKLLPMESASFERGGALRDAFLASSGRAIACLNAEQPCEPGFYSRAIALLAGNEADLVRANRRLAESRFRIPVRFLPLVYGRHRMGLGFNRLVRGILPVTSTDTHSGAWVMRREAAFPVFALQRFSGFLFDLEIGLVATAHGLREKDLPVTLHLAQEKSPRRIGLEAWSILRGLPRLAWRYRAGCYHPQPGPRAVTADDWGITPGVNSGILDLARRGVVRRVSVLVNSGYFREGLSELKAIPGVEIGLHFDLTFGKGSPASVLRRWVRPASDREALAAEARTELERQLGLLRSTGAHPTYLDGHHHIHLVPGLLDAIAPVLRAAGIRRARLPYDPALWRTKPALAALALSARRSFARLGLESLPCLYPQPAHFRDQGRLRALMGRNPDAEVIVHPADRDDLLELGIPDPYTAGRVTEFQALRMLGAK